jgi:hypothetical protein
VIVFFSLLFVARVTHQEKRIKEIFLSLTSTSVLMRGIDAYFLCQQARVLESLLAETNNLICAEAVKRIIMGQANNCRLSVEQDHDATWLILNCEGYALSFTEKPPSMMADTNQPALMEYANWLVLKGLFAIGLDMNTPSTRNICGIRLIKQSPLTITTGFVRKHRYHLHEVSFSIKETLWGERYESWSFVLSRTMKRSDSPTVIVVTIDLECKGDNPPILGISIMTPDPHLRRIREAERLAKAITNKLDYAIKGLIDEFSMKMAGYI